MSEPAEARARWYAYPSSKNLTIGAYAAAPGSSPVSLYWPGRTDGPHLHKFFMDAAKAVKANADADAAVYTTVAETEGDDIVEESREATPPLPCAELSGILRFELTLQTDANVGEADENAPDLITWASLDPLEGETDSIGIYATSEVLKILRNDVVNFISETTGSTSRQLIASMLDRLQEDLADNTK